MNKEIEELIEQAKSLQENMQKIQKKLEDTFVKGVARFVKFVKSCKYSTREVDGGLLPLCIEEGVFEFFASKCKDTNDQLAFKKLMEKVQTVQNKLLADADNDASSKIEKIVQDEVSSMTAQTPPSQITSGVPGGFRPPI